MKKCCHLPHQHATAREDSPFRPLPTRPVCSMLRRLRGQNHPSPRPMSSLRQIAMAWPFTWSWHPPSRYHRKGNCDVAHNNSRRLRNSSPALLMMRYPDGGERQIKTEHRHQLAHPALTCDKRQSLARCNKSCRSPESGSREFSEDPSVHWPWSEGIEPASCCH